jgi:hypothetical protein
MGIPLLFLLLASGCSQGDEPSGMQADASNPAGT